MPKPVILCIGTDKVPGDSLGPVVGDLLIMKYNIDAFVYGHSAKPVNGINYEDYIEHISLHHKNSLIIAIDACVGREEDIGRIKISTKGLVAGEALKKKNKTIGDVALLGVVAKAGKDNLEQLKNADVALIRSMANTMAKITVSIVNYAYNIKNLCFSVKKRENSACR
ncbi:MAG: spore protease YyaC [Bacillota bacterium]|jgi:putative sporulation protein YyaC|nr:spore protease YyaC [Bacillota bacterium]HHU43360.1 spore protease YyaC [Clostridiales bacterium]